MMKTTRIPVMLLAASLAACQPPEPQAVPAPPVSENPAPASAAPAAAPAANPADPTSTPAAPAQPAPQAPPPTEPAAAPKPTASAAEGPSLESMSLARPSAKISVAVDLRYEFDGAVVTGQPATLYLAAIPRVAGTNFAVRANPAPGLEISHGTLSAQKVDAAGVYRQQLSVTRHASGPDNLRVLVTMEMPEGTAFGFFTIPLDGGNTAQKSDSVKQR